MRTKFVFWTLIAAALLLPSLVAVGINGARQAATVSAGQPAPAAGRPADGPRPNHFVHPCGGMHPQPPYMGISPLAMADVPGGGCNRAIGDMTVWQANGSNYVGFAGYLLNLFHIYNVDDSYNPVAIATQPLPTGGTATTSIFAFKQGTNSYISMTLRGTGTGCGYFVYNVTNPASPQFVARKVGADWCSPHEHFVSHDSNGNADYAWLAMGSESGSAYKVVALNLADLSNIQETGRYQRNDATSDNYVHDVTVIGQRVFLAHWSGGLIIHDKATLAANINPTPLNPVDSIRPSNFRVHHSWPTSDGNHIFIEDELLSASNQEKVKLYNIADINNPFYEWGSAGPDATALLSQAHNLKILNQSPGHDLLLVAWYRAGLRGFEVDTTGPTPVITHTLTHQIQQTPGSGFGGAWGVDYLPCIVRGQPRTCLYTSEYAPSYGLIVDTLGTDPSLDPYAPESAISDPLPNQTITGCSYTIQGTAHDYYSGVASVEVSTDGGTTWVGATGTANWSYQWTIPADGSYALRVRARDVANNLETPAAPVNVQVIGCTTPLATETPTTPPTSPPTATTPPSSTAMPTDTATAIAPTATRTPTVPPSPTRTGVPPTATLTPCVVNFSDVAPTDYFYLPVQTLACRGVISGYSDGTFRPYNNTTRAQMVKIVVLGFNLPIVTPTAGGYTFADVPTNNTFFSLIETAGAGQIVSGYSCGGPGEPCDGQNRPYFRPNNNVTRGQLSKIVVIAAGWATVSPATGSFEDVPPSSAFYIFVETAYCRGIISGYTCGGAGEPCGTPPRPYFRQFNNATRGQIAKIVYGSLAEPAPCSPGIAP